MGPDTITLNINNLTCRICLENNNVKNSLYDTVQYEQTIELKDLLLRVTNIEIHCNGLNEPDHICDECTSKLLNAYDFIVAVEKSEKILLQLFNDDVKISEVAEHITKDGVVTIEQVPYEDNSEKNEEFFLYSDNEEAEVPHCNQEEVFEEQKFEEEGEEEEPLPMDDIDEMSMACVKEEMVEEYVADQKEFQSTDDNTSWPSPKPESSKRPPIGSRLNNQRTDDWVKCDKCKRSFAKQESLTRHIKNAHTYIVSPDKIAAMVKETENEKEQKQCPHCPRTYIRKDNLQRHILALHGDTVDMAMFKSEANKKKPEYKRGLCPYCGESFSQASLIIHIRRHTGDNPYKCEVCGKGFPRRQDMKIHERQHTGERPHVCNVCGKSFIRPNKLTRHMRIHTGQRPYKCNKCNKGFSQSNDLKIHMRRHTGEKPYKCGICGEAFICGTGLKNHRKQSSHYEPTDDTTDPYAKCRVSNRYNKNGISEVQRRIGFSGRETFIVAADEKGE